MDRSELTPMTEEEYKKIVVKLNKMLDLIRQDEINNAQAIEVIYNTFFIIKN